MVLKHLMIILSAFILIPSVNASDDTSVYISLIDSVRIAYESNLDLASMRLGVNAAYQEIGMAASQFSPRFDVEQTFVRTNQQVSAFGLNLNHAEIAPSDFDPEKLNHPDWISDYGTALNLTQPIFNGGREMIGYRLAKKGYEQAIALGKNGIENILHETVKTYLGALLAREGLKISKEAVGIAETNLVMIQQRFDQGMVIKSDLLQAKVHLSELQQREIRATNQFQIALAGLNTILGSPDGRYYPSGDLDGGVCPDISLEKLIEWANSDHPDLISHQKQVEFSDLKVKLAKAPFLPNINAQIAYQYHGTSPVSDGDDSMTVALSFGLNLFNGTGDYRRMKQSQYNLMRDQKSYESKKNMIALDVRKAYFELAAAQKQLEVASEAVNQAEEGLRILEERYRQGASNIVDLLNTELALADAKFNRMQAKHDLLMGNASLCKSVGHLYSRLLEPEKCPIP